MEVAKFVHVWTGDSPCQRQMTITPPRHFVYSALAIFTIPVYIKSYLSDITWALFELECETNTINLCDEILCFGLKVLRDPMEFS